MTVALAWAARTDIGRRREQNEDAWAGEAQASAGAPPRGLFAVCDGMGGHAGGEEASAMAVDALRRSLAWSLSDPWPEPAALSGRVRDALLLANRAIHERNEGRQDKARAGTTAALLLVAGTDACLAHVGDSRVYQVTAAGARQLTADHNVAGVEIARGADPAQAWARPDARHLVQALGPRPDEHVRPDVQLLTVEEDSLFLLCTDGLSDNGFVESQERALLRPLLAPAADLEAGGQALIEAANAANGHDNLTAVLVRITGLRAGRPRSRVPTTARVKRATTATGRRGGLFRRLLGPGR